jgi:hypothetical protein
MSENAPQGSQMPTAAVPGLGRAFDHVLIIMFENMYRGYVLGNPYMRRLARQGIQLGNFFGVMHPSQTNYIASIAGELCNVTSDERPPPLAQRTIVDLLEEAPGRLRWKAYMESYVPEATPWTPKDFRPADASPYFIKHNPFSSFSSILKSEGRWRHIENESALFADLLNGEFPEYAWLTPNIWNDGHWVNGTTIDPSPRAPVLVDQQAKWLEQFFNRLRFPGPRSHLPPNTLVVVTFDESDFEEKYQPDVNSTYDGPNQIYTVLLSNSTEPGFEEEGYNHYSLLRTIEVNFGLDHLRKNDAGANWFQFLWGRRFEWSAPQATPLEGFDGPMAAAGYAGALFVACAEGDGTIRLRNRSAEHGRWSAEETLPIDGSGGIAMASTFGELVLVARSAAGGLSCMKYDLQQGWRADAAPAHKRVAAVALASFDHERRIMLALRDDAGNLTSHVRGEPGAKAPWGKATPVPAAKTDGGIALGTLGESVYLIVKTPRRQSMSVVSYNTGLFNVVSVKKNKYGGPWDNTTVGAWSPSAFPVAHFSSRPDMKGKRQPQARPYETSGPMAIATMDGVMHLVHPGPTNPLLLTETFSISGVMTPIKPVSYKNAAKDVNNGFGTLAEAGWSHQSPIFEAGCGPGGVLAMGRAGRQILLLYRTSAGSPVWLHEGSYVRKTG